MNRWWTRDPEEIYWLEITDRSDIGVDLNAPQRKDDGTEYWGYSLIKEVREGDVVFHYRKGAHAISSASTATGTVWEDPVIWAARGTTARSAGVVPYRRAGWRLGLENFTELAPVTLDDVRAQRPGVLRVREAIEEAFGAPTYFPFELSDRRPLRPTHCYLAKLPKGLLSLFPALLEASGTLVAATQTAQEPGEQPMPATPAGFGDAYRPADESVQVTTRDPMSVDPALVERGLRGHRRTQNQLAALVESRGLMPRSPRPGEPNFDVAWEDGDKLLVVEVKSITEANAEKQLRLGVGQVLRYSQILATRYSEKRVLPVVACESRPQDSTWEILCNNLGIALVWPDTFDSILS